MNLRSPTFLETTGRSQKPCWPAAITIVLCVAQSLCAQTAADPATTTKASMATGLVSVARDPFWPVTYRPKAKEPPASAVTAPESTGGATPAVAAVVAAAKPEPRWPELRLRGLVKDARGGYIAVVDPFGMVALGQILELKQDGFVYRWKVSAITEKGATCSRLDAKAQ